MRTERPSPRRVALFAAAALVLTACGGGSTAPSSSSGNPTSGNPTGGNPTGGGNSISVAGTTFEPSAVTIGQGGSVTWVFAGITHNVTFTGTGKPADVPNTSSGSVSRTFSTKGTFGMTCTLHAGMTGTITVQ